MIAIVIGKFAFLNCANKDIFGWVPSHVGIRGNKRAKSAAKSVLELPHAKVGVPYIDIQVYFFHLTRCLEWCCCVQALFCQASPERLAFLLQEG